MNRNNVYLASKPRYEILDGLRGMAAMIVVAYHLLETYYHSSPEQPLNHGYLAVDFYFVLSGFVIGYAYDDRWDRMSVLNFFKRRLVRLHPMVILGSVLGAAFFYLQACSAFPVIADTPWWMVLVVLLWAFTMIPMPQSMDIRGWAETNPLNGPAWSLQWEYLANILYALFFRHLSRLALALCVAVFGFFTIVLCLNVDLFGVLQIRESAAYTVIGGWCLTPDQLQIGLTRLMYPFFCGLLISRMGWLIRLKGGFWWCALAVVVLLCMPWMGLGDQRWTNGLYEMLCILVAFPLVVMAGAGSSVKGSKSSAINKFLGEISYPLYITHFPFIYLQISWAERNADLPVATHVFVACGLFLLAVLTAWASLRLYDIPVRKWLKDKLFSRSAKN